MEKEIKGIEEIDEIKYKEDMESQEEEWKKEMEDRKNNPSLYMAKGGIKQRYLSATLDGIKLPPRIIKTAEQFIAGKIDGLFLTGVIGSGKTYLACAIARELVIQGKSVRFKSAPELFEDIRASFNGRGSEYEIIDRLSKTKYLIIDDAGAEKSSDFTLDRLYLIIDHRYSDELPTIITSNLSLNDIKNRIHDRLASRISEMCETIVMPNKDLRLELKVKGGDKK